MSQPSGQPTAETIRYVSVLVSMFYEVDELTQTLACIRCREPVTWITRHMAERHGDDVRVVPPLPRPDSLPPLW